MEYLFAIVFIAGFGLGMIIRDLMCAIRCKKEYGNGDDVEFL